jgi:hypothetical protein
MSKKLIFVMISMLGISLALSGVSFAIRLLDRDKAMEEIFGSECKIVSETKDLKGAKLENVKKARVRHHPAKSSFLWQLRTGKRSDMRISIVSLENGALWNLSSDSTLTAPSRERQ